MTGPTARFTNLEPGLYKLKLEAEDHHPQTLTLGLSESRRLDIQLREHR